MMRPNSLLLAVPLAAVCTACAAAPPAGEAPAAPAYQEASAGYGQPPPASPAQAYPSQTSAPPAPQDAEARLAQAEADLDEALGPRATAPVSPAPAGAPRPLSTTDACSVVCRALSSMRSSAQEICGLGDAGRCQLARDRVTRAERRASEACPACASPT